MARPKLGESETERLHIKITKDEIRDIDEWRYDHRIPSRSEAVRRLCQMALILDRELSETVETVALGVQNLQQQYEEIVGVSREVLQEEFKDVVFTQEEIRDVFNSAEDIASFSFETVEAIYRIIASLHEIISPFYDAESVSKGTELSNKRLEEANEAVERTKAQRDEQNENRYLALWVKQHPDEQDGDYEMMSSDDKEVYLSRVVEELQKEEAADPIGFSEKYGLTPFWVKSNWADELRRKAKDHIK